MIKALQVEAQAALLLEYQATSREELDHLARAARPTLDKLPVGGPVELADDPKLRADLWTLRKGLYTSVAGARKSGTTALLETFPLPRMIRDIHVHSTHANLDNTAQSLGKSVLGMSYDATQQQ